MSRVWSGLKAQLGDGLGTSPSLVRFYELSSPRSAMKDFNVSASSADM